MPISSQTKSPTLAIKINIITLTLLLFMTKVRLYSIWHNKLFDVLYDGISKDVLDNIVNVWSQSCLYKGIQ